MRHDDFVCDNNVMLVNVMIMRNNSEKYFSLVEFLAQNLIFSWKIINKWTLK